MGSPTQRSPFFRAVTLTLEGTTLSDEQASGTATSGDVVATGAGASVGSDSAGPAEQGDFVGKANANPGWAGEQVRAFQSSENKATARATAAENELKSFKEGLGKYSNDTPENIALHLDKFVGPIVSDPSKQEGFDAWISGKAVQEPEDEDEYLSPEALKIRALEAQLADTNSRLGRQESGSGAQHLKGHFEKFRQKWAMKPDTDKRVQEGLIKYVRDLSSNGAAGRQALTSLQDPEQGYALVSAIALNWLTEDERIEAVDNLKLRRQGKLGEMATDSRMLSSSSGSDPAPEFEDSEDAIRYAENNPGILERRYPG